MKMVGMGSSGLIGFVKVLFFLVGILFVEIETSDPHESISRRTPSGVPYYLESVPLPEKSFFTTTGLIIVEYNLGPNDTTLRKPQRVKQEGQNLREFGSNEILESCQLGGDIFHGMLVLSREERTQFYEQLEGSCFSDKLLELNGDDVMPEGNYSDGEILEHNWNICKSKRNIPEHILPPEYLQLELGNFSELVNSNFQLSLGLSDISTYYEEPIASCVFTQEGSFILAIQIPLISNSEMDSLQSHKLTPIPLWMPSDQNTVCHLQDGADPDFPEGTYLITSPGGKEVIREEEATLCPSHLCPLPNQHDQITKRSMRRSCVQAIMEALDEDIACTMKCEPSGTFNFPIIRQVASDRYLIVGNLRSSDTGDVDKLRVECPPFQKEEILTFPNTGALEIILPCDCHIRYGREIFKSGGEGSCGAEFSKVPITFPGRFEIIV